MEDTTCLFALSLLLLYLSVGLERLGAGGKRAVSTQYYNAKPLSLIRQGLEGKSSTKRACLQAILWLSAIAFWQGEADVSRTHLVGIKALLGHNQLDGLSQE